MMRRDKFKMKIRRKRRVLSTCLLVVILNQYIWNHNPISSYAAELVDMETEYYEETDETDFDKETGEIDDFGETEDELYIQTEYYEEKLLIDSCYDEASELQKRGYISTKEFMFVAETEKEAENIATAYGGQLIDYVNGYAVAVMETSEDVISAFKEAGDITNTLPPIWPNYERVIADEDVEKNDSITEHAYSDPSLRYDSGSYQWHHFALKDYVAWDAGIRGEGITVAVLDTGVNVVDGLNVIDSVDCQNTGSSQDIYGHGTTIASIIGGAFNNGINGAGIAPGVSILNIKITDDNGNSSDRYIIQGIDEAINRGADIINISLGNPGYNWLVEQKINEAYEMGIPVVSSAGNEGGNNKYYPAGYRNAICVTASMENNGRPYFANYGNWVNFSAPGWHIYADDVHGDMVMNNGTSYSAAMISGCLALLKSSGKLTDAKVETMVKKLQEGCKTKNLSTVGYIVPDMGTILDIKDTMLVPNAPVFSQGTSTVNEESIKIRISSLNRNDDYTIYYTLDGTTPTYAGGKPGSSAIEIEPDSEIEIGGKGTVKLNAICVNSAGVCSAVTSAIYTFKPCVREISITGSSELMIGKNILVKAELLPTYAANKNVTWSIEPSGQGVTIASVENQPLSKKIIASKTAKSGIYTVKVMTKDQGENFVYATKEIYVTEQPQIRKIDFDENKIEVIRADKDVDISVFQSMKLTYGDDQTIKCQSETAAKFDWKTSNNSIATISTDGILHCIAPGSVTVTVATKDGSALKATMTVVIKQRITEISIAGKNVLISNTTGGSSETYKVTITPANASTKTVEWKVEPSNIGITINNGKLTVPANCSVTSCIVTAQAKDGSGVICSKRVGINPKKAGAVYLTDKEVSDKKYTSIKRTLFRVRGVSNADTDMQLTVTCKNFDVTENIPYEFTSSNTEIATVDQNGYVKVTGKCTGTVTIKCTLKDGSTTTDANGNTIASYATAVVNVVNPASSLSITMPSGRSEYVASGKTLQLGSVVGTAFGNVSNKQVSWISSNTAIASVNSSGLVTFKSNGGEKVMITATMKDGSGLNAKISLYATTPVKNIGMADTEGNVLAGNKFSMKKGDKKEYILMFNAPNADDYLVKNTCPYVAVTSSDPDTLYAYPGKGMIILKASNITGTKPVTLTLMALDGTGLKQKFYLTVTE